MEKIKLFFEDIYYKIYFYVLDVKRNIKDLKWEAEHSLPRKAIHEPGLVMLDTIQKCASIYANYVDDCNANGKELLKKAKQCNQVIKAIDDYKNAVSVSDDYQWEAFTLLEQAEDVVSNKEEKALQKEISKKQKLFKSNVEKTKSKMIKEISQTIEIIENLWI